MKPFSAVLLGLACALPMYLRGQAPSTSGDHDLADNGTREMDHKTPIPPSHSLNITFGSRLTTLTIADLSSLPQTTVHVHNMHSNADETYTGPLLSDVLARAGLPSGKETDSVVLHSSVVATGTDHYFVLYSAAEVMPSFAKGQVIVAIMKSGQADTGGGLIQLINTADTRPARWVHGLANLNLVTMTRQP